MKRALLIFLIFWPLLASADVVEIGGIYYELVPKANAAAVVKNPNGYTGSVVIPSSVTYDGKVYSVTRIAESAFAGCNTLTSVTIPEGVNTIEQRAFRYSSLTSIAIPGTVKSIGDEAFYCCDSLISATLLDGVASIGNYAFSFCTKLASVTIPNSVTSFGGSAFCDCVSLASISIPDGVTNIAVYTFSGCNNITSITIPTSVTNIGGYAFSGCKGLTSITIPSSVTTMGRNTFSSCCGLTSVTFSGGELSIGRDSFKDCDAITEVHVPDLESWFKIAFENAFSCPLFTALHLYVGGEEIKDLVIPDGVTSIGAFAFYNLSTLDSVTIPSSVTGIGQSAFLGCTGLTSITIPNSVTSIGESAFEACSGLTSLTLGNNVTSIGRFAFSDCSGLTSLTIPDSVSSLRTSVFAGCSGLTSVTIPNGVTTIEDAVFRNCSGLTTLTIGSGVASIGSNAFASCPELMNVYCFAVNVPYSHPYTSDGYGLFENSFIKYATLHVPAASVSAYQAVYPWKNFQEIVALPVMDDYRSFVEDGKVWMVKVYSDNASHDQYMEYLYFDGDTLINGQTAKRMLRDRMDSKSDATGEYVGAWYEQDKKVYFAGNRTQQFKLLYDFTLSSSDSISISDYDKYVVNKLSGSIPGFKGTYYEFLNNGDVMDRWFEGVGSESWPSQNHPWLITGHVGILLACAVGNEIIYYNSKMGNPYVMGSRKRRFDFTHTIKTKPKSRMTRGADPSLYGEYNDLQLGINLDPLDDAYLVRITDDSGKTVYEKAVNAGNIVGLNIDISDYPEGRYTVTVENSNESFTGEFDAQTTGLSDALRLNKKEEITKDIYNLQGQRLRTLQKGLNIVNGRKVYVK